MTTPPRKASVRLQERWVLTTLLQSRDMKYHLLNVKCNICKYHFKKIYIFERFDVFIS